MSFRRSTHSRCTVRRAQRGWSLIELLSTITIMGVVSASVLPRLTEWTQHARTSTLQHLAGTLQVAGTMARMRCAIEKGCDINAGVSRIRYDGQPVLLLRGYPQGGTPQGIAQVVMLAELAVNRVLDRLVPTE